MRCVQVLGVCCLSTLDVLLLVLGGCRDAAVA